MGVFLFLKQKRPQKKCGLLRVETFGFVSFQIQKKEAADECDLFNFKKTICIKIIFCLFRPVIKQGKRHRYPFFVQFIKYFRENQKDRGNLYLDV